MIIQNIMRGGTGVMTDTMIAAMIRATTAITTVVITTVVMAGAIGTVITTTAPRGSGAITTTATPIDNVIDRA